MNNELTSKERIELALQGREVDHVPYCPFLAYIWEHFPEEIRKMGQLKFHQMIGSDPLWRDGPWPVKAITPQKMETLTTEENGKTITEIRTPVGKLHLTCVKSESGHTNFLVEHPLKTEEDYKVQMWIEENTRFEPDPQPVEDHFAGPGRVGLTIGMLLPRGKSAFQNLIEHLVGTEELNYALVDFPDTVETLWRTMVEKNIQVVRLAAESRYDYFITWEDSSTQNYSPAQYDKYIGSEISQWCGILAGHGKKYIQHACGHVKVLVGRMKAQGVYAVESISTPPTGNITIREAREIIGSDMGIIGGIEPTKFLLLSEKELGPYVESVIDQAQGGPFVLGNSDSCPPGVTIEKFKLIAQIAKSRKWRGAGGDRDISLAKLPGKP